MGQIQNGHLYMSYISNPQKEKQRNAKTLQNTCTYLGYSIAKSALEVLLTFNTVEKTKRDVNFVCPFSSSSFFFFSDTHTCRSKVYSVCEYYTVEGNKRLMFRLHTTIVVCSAIPGFQVPVTMVHNHTSTLSLIVA